MVLIKLNTLEPLGICTNSFTFQYGSNQIDNTAKGAGAKKQFTFQYGSNQIPLPY